MLLQIKDDYDCDGDHDSYTNRQGGAINKLVPQAKALGLMSEV